MIDQKGALRGGERGSPRDIGILGSYTTSSEKTTHISAQGASLLSF